MAKRHISKAILGYLADRANAGLGPGRAEDITVHLAEPRPTVNRYLAKLVAAGDILREGAGPGTVYRLARPVTSTNVVTETVQANDTAQATVSPPWSSEAQMLRAQLRAPLGTRSPVSYQRKIVDDYRPNQSSLLDPGLAEALFAEGRMQGRQPAGTYARKVLEQLL